MALLGRLSLVILAVHTAATGCGAAIGQGARANRHSSVSVPTQASRRLMGSGAPAAAPSNPACPQLWQRDYINIHNHMLSVSQDSQRLVVFDAEHSGLSDRMFNLVPAFYFALLTGRAFKVKWKSQHPLESALSQPSINWTFVASDLEHNSTWNNEFYGLDVAKDALRHLFQHEDFNLHHPDYRTIRFTSNEGQIARMFNNPFHKSKLEAWGLRPDTAFGCAFNFLFALTDQAIATVRGEYDALAAIRSESEKLATPSTLVIGIQIRLGDHTALFRRECQQSPSDAEVSAFFQCAQQLERTLTTAGPGVKVPKVVWYLVTDCAGLRKKAQEVFGATKVITSTGILLDHSHDARSNMQAGFLSSFGESWVLGMADYHIISEKSAFGRMSALRSLRSRNIFTLVRPGHAYHRNGGCHANDYDEFRAISSVWVNV